jgi:Plasmid pRiA4b ORF-3-like protein
MPKPPGRSAFRLRIQLNDFEPVIWRRIVSPGAIHLDKFANVLSAAMGWSNSHLHAFNICDERYGMNYDDFPEGEVDERPSRSSRLCETSAASPLNTTWVTRGNTRSSLKN